jgi:hypothetical protein
VKKLNRGKLNTKKGVYKISEVKQNSGTPPADDCFNFLSKESCNTINCIWFGKRNGNFCSPKDVNCNDSEKKLCEALNVLGKCVWRIKTQRCLIKEIQCANKVKNDCLIFEKFGDCVWNSGSCSSPKE